MGKITTTEVLLLLKELNETEIKYDFNKAKSIFESLGWADWSKFPDFNCEDILEKAKLWRYAGAFLLRWSKVKTLHFTEIGKEILSKAQRIFAQCHAYDWFADTELFQSATYGNQGALEDYQVFLKHLEEKTPKENNIYLHIQAAFLVVEIHTQNFNKGKARVLKIIPYFDHYTTPHIKAMFCINAGIIFRHLKDFEVAENYFKTAIKLSQEIGNRHLEAHTCNNLANHYLNKYIHYNTYSNSNSNSKKDLEQAQVYSEASFNLLSQDDDLWRAHYFDTLANIFLAKKEYLEAHIQIQEALKIFRNSQDYIGWITSLWTGIEIEITTGFQSNALQQFNELWHIASNFVSPKIANIYFSKFNSRVYFHTEGNLYEQVKEYKKFRILKEMEKTTVLTEIAKNLKIDRTSLSKMITREFPELKENLNEFKNNPKSK